MTDDKRLTEIEHWIPENPNGVFEEHPEQWRKDLIKKLWKHYKSAYDMHGIKHLNELRNLIDKRIKKLCNVLNNEEKYPEDTFRKVQAYSLRINEHCLVLDRMIIQYQERGTVNSITNGICNELTVQLNSNELYSEKKMREIANDLSKKPEYQIGKGKPHKTKIRKEVQKQMTRKVGEQTLKPSMKTVQRKTF